MSFRLPNTTCYQVDSTPDLSHVDQLTVIIRYLHNGKPVERFTTFLQIANYTGEHLVAIALENSSIICQ